MFAIFNLGAQELIILAVLGLMMLGILVAVVLAVVFLTRRGQSRDDSSDV